MSTVSEPFDEVKQAILGDRPSNPMEVPIYNQACVALEGYIDIFERTLRDPFNMQANATVLGMHMSGIALTMSDKLLLKLQRDCNSTLYTDACQRFLDYYTLSVPRR